MSSTNNPQLKRQLGLSSAVLLGLGSILGTGVFVSLGLTAGVCGSSVILATALAAFVALCNAFSSAQLAANHPVSGGTYEYGYEYLNPGSGFVAGWLFLWAKSASAATAALGFAGYFSYFFGLDSAKWGLPLAGGAVILLTMIVFLGIRRSNMANTLIVSVTLLSLLVFVGAGIPRVLELGSTHFVPFFLSSSESPSLVKNFLEGSALMFVAFTGYGRIATLGEEVVDPRQTIPRAIITTLLVSAGVYILVAVVGIGLLGAPQLSEATRGPAAPLEIAAQESSFPAIHPFISLGAVTAMLGVLLNLILGLSRVLLAMGRRGDMPRVVSRLNRDQTTPSVAVAVMGSFIFLLTMIGDIKMIWSFSAFSVLIYYAITNLCALRIKREDRLFHPFFSYCGLASCFFLAFWVEWEIWLVGLGLIGVGCLKFLPQR